MSPSKLSMDIFILVFFALLLRDVESQADTRCYLQNQCTQTIPEGNVDSVADCCTEERLSMIDGETCGNRGDVACSVYFRRPQSQEECQACVFIGFQNDSFILRENDAQAMLRVELLSFGAFGFFLITPAIDQALTNATENEDYSLPSGQQLFYRGTVPDNTNINIDIRNDNVALEPVEVIKLNLVLSDPLLVGRHSTTIIIVDNDELFINVSAAFIRVMEGSASAVSFTITKDKETAVDVGIKVTPLTYQQYSNKAATDATLPSLSNITTPSDPAEERDFNNTAVQLSLGKESSSVIVNMEGLVNDDNIFEEPEGFILLVELINPDPRVRLNNSVIAIEIVSDERLILTLDQTLLQLNESSGTASINIVPFNGTISELETPITLPYESQPSLIGDATVSPETSVAYNGTRATLLVTPVKDNILEDIVNSTITFSTGNRPNIEFRPTNSVNVIIIDDENVTLRLSADSTVVNEGSPFNVCVSIAEPSDIGSFIIPIALTLIPYPPTQEEDYDTNSNLLLTLDQSNRSTCFLIRTNEDEITEENERFGIRMELQDSPQTEVYRSRTKYDPQVLNMTINNDDRVTIGFLMRAVTVEEGSNPVNICFTVKEGTLARSVNVNISSSSSTAAIGTDYNFTSSVYTFNSNINEHCASFVPIDDDIIENPEVVAIQLNSNDPAVTFDIDTETVTITDNDRANVSFSQATYTASEDGRTLSYTVTISGNLDRNVIVSVNDIAGTATRNVDYSSVSEVITFNNSYKSFTGVLMIVNDSIVENTENLILSLSSSDTFVDLANATVNIADSASSRVRIGFLRRAVTVEEGSNPVSICFSVKEGTLARNVNVNVSSSSNTAAIGTDYNFTSSVYTFNSNINEHCASFVPIDDDIIEAPEVVAIQLNSNDPAVTFDIDTETVTITDNDRANVSFSQATYTASEDGRTLSYTVTISGNLDRNVVVSVNDIAGTATRNVDYSSVSEVITFNNSYKSFTGVLMIVNDSIVENTENLILSLSSSDTFVDLVNATVNIADSATSSVSLSFALDSQTVSESVGSVPVCVRLVSGRIQSPRQVSVFVSTTDGTAKGDSDYAPLSMSRLTFDASGTMQCVNIGINNDTLYEINESFNAIASSDDPAAHFNTNTSTITIQDNNMLAISTSLPIGMINVSESSGQQTFCFNISRGTIDTSSTAVTITVTPSSQSATAGVDYSARTQSFSFTSNDVTHCYSFNVTDDQNFENVESFQLALSSSSPRVTFNTPNIVVNIIDNDGVILNFDSIDPVSEEAGVVTVCVRVENSQLLQRSITVQLSTIQGTASEFNDYTPLNGEMLEIEAGTGLACTNVTLLGDDSVEGTESFSIRMNAGLSGVAVGSDLTIQLLDDDDATVRLIGPTDAVSEGGGSFNSRVEVIGKLEIPITLFLSTINGTAKAGEDFTSVMNMSITLSGTSSFQNIPITIREDTLVEGEESFEIAISLRPVEGANIRVSPGTVRTRISDNDRVRIGFVMRAVTVEEGSNPVSICFSVKEGTLARNVNVNVSSSSNTAAIGTDYNFTSSVYTFNSNINEHCASFVPIDDDIIENPEVVAIQLSSNDPAVTFDIDTETVTITDNDRATVSFSQATYTASEDGRTLSYTVTISGNLDRNVIVSVNDIAGTATRNVDYSSVSEVITFNNSYKSFTGVLMIVNDSIVENTENLILSLSSSDTFVDLVNATVNIADSATSRVLIGFVMRTVTVEESSNPVSICFTVMEGTLARNVNVNVSSSSNTAAIGDDYRLSSTLFTFNSSVTSNCLLFSALTDDILERQELVFLNLISTDPAFVTDRNSLVIITDANRVRVEFQQKNRTVSEGAGVISVCAMLVLNNTRQIDRINASVLVVNGTALENVDFILNSNEFSFTTDSLTSCIPITIIDDQIIEPFESFSLRLSILTTGLNVFMPENEEMNITIVEDNVAVFEFTRQSYTVNEGQTIEICVEVANNVILQEDVTIMVNSETIEAADGVDYRTVNETLLYRRGGPDVCFNVSSISDGFVERMSERFRLRLSSRNPTVAATDTAIVTINDTDVLGVVFPSGTQEVTEGDTVPVCITTNTTTDIRLSVIIDIMDITTAYPADYTPQQLSITIPPSTPGQFCSNLFITNDEEPEEDETLVLILSTATPPRIVPLQSTRYTILIHDNDDFGIICNINATRWISTFNGTNGYLFDRNCEHRLVFSCNSSQIDVRVDFLNDSLSSGVIALTTSGHKIVFSADSVLMQPDPPVTNISITQQARSVNVRIIDIGLNVNYSNSGIRVTVIGGPSVTSLSGLCGTLAGDLVYSDCFQRASTQNKTSVEEFKTSHFVQAPDQIARPNREECGLIRNDTAQGDPLFTVPIHTRPGSVLTQSLHLCYEIHGRSDKHFNFVSDDCTSVTAHYSQARNAPRYNIIDRISIVSIDSANQCHYIQVNREGCTASYDGTTVAIGGPGVGSIRSPFTRRGISIRRYSDRVRIKVPNCADVSLAMWVICETVNMTDPYTSAELGPVDMIKFIIARGFNLHEYSHGLLGQFWNIPINVTRFNGTSTYPPSYANQLYAITVNHPVDPTRQFVGLLHRSWTRSGMTCLYSGNKQAGKIREVESPNDPVIRGDYMDYEVSTPFETQFRYSVFRSDVCSL